MGGPVLAAAQQVWSFLKGCAAFVGEVIGSVRQVVSQMKELVDDPQRFVEEKVQLVLKMVSARRTPGASPPRSWARCSTSSCSTRTRRCGGASWPVSWPWASSPAVSPAASGRLAKQLADLPGLMKKIDDWLTRRNNGGDDDGGEGDDTDAGDACPTSSFPTGTEVLLADGTRRPIDQVHPGDMVFAFDPKNGSWAPGPC